jgi:hypothetical protein
VASQLATAKPAPTLLLVRRWHEGAARNRPEPLQHVLPWSAVAGASAAVANDGGAGVAQSWAASAMMIQSPDPV